MSKYHFNPDTKELFICDKKINFSNSGYKLNSEIGHGANGIVLKGEDSVLKRTVAIKFWLPHRKKTKPDPNKFYNEIQKIAQMDSDKIVKIYSANIIEESYFYAVYEFVQGESLKKWLEKEQNFRLRCFVLEQIYTEMNEVHEKGIYHGDLHEENILITSECDIKIIDFGTSFFARTEDDSHQRETELLLNTGLSILKHEGTQYNLLEISILKASPPECIPPAMLMLSEIIKNFKRMDALDEESDDYWDDYNQGNILLSLSYSICESPFFNLERIIQLLKNSGMDDKYIDLFVSATLSDSLARISEVDSYTIVHRKANRENIDLLKLTYSMLRIQYLRKFSTVNTDDN
jgi:serine/threonine protein kinase